MQLLRIAISQNGVCAQAVFEDFEQRRAADLKSEKKYLIEWIFCGEYKKPNNTYFNHLD